MQRGELVTGAFGEGFVDRRHPHAYIHELLAGVEFPRDGTPQRPPFDASFYVGRGFAPFGSDDPMTRPFEKYPVNHHLGQILERVVAIAAVRYGPIIGEVATFNGDEPASPGEAPAFNRFGDSWSSRITVLLLAGAEVSGSIARVARLRSGRVPAWISIRRVSPDSSAERQDHPGICVGRRAHTAEVDGGRRITSLTTVLGEAAVCRAGVIVAGRLERTDRPEEEPLADPFRVPRPAGDLSNLGVSRWTTLTASISAPRVQQGIVSGRPFIEIARIGAAAGTPPGIFNAELRYGARRMWMYSAGIRLRAGSMHDRMGRYGAALPAMTMGDMGTHSGNRESDKMPPMADMPQLWFGNAVQSMSFRCSVLLVSASFRGLRQ
jgi:hypothetical protein